MHTERPGRSASSWGVWIEGGGLLVATPFLLFPTQFVIATAVSLLIVAISWAWPLLSRRTQIFPSSPLNTVLLLWGIMLLVGIGVTADPDLTLSKATGLILGLAYWRYIIKFTHDKQRLRVAYLGFVVLGLGFALFGLLGINWLDKVSFLSPIISRLPSQFIRIPESPSTGVGANQIAGAIEIHLVFLLSIMLGWQPEKRPRLLKGATAVLFTGLVGLLILTQSRSGWVGFAGGIFVLLILWGMTLPSGKWRRIIWMIVALFIGAGLVGFIWVGPDQIVKIWNDPVQDTAIGQLGTLNFRKEVWQWGVAAVQDFPFTGTGLGTFRQVVRRLYPLNVPFDYDIAHAHNIFLQVALDVGLPGLVAYLAILLITVALGWQVAKKDEGLRPFVLGLLAGLAALHIYDLTDVVAPGSKPGLIFWAALGLITAMHQIVVQPAGRHDSD